MTTEQGVAPPPLVPRLIKQVLRGRGLAGVFSALAGTQAVNAVLGLAFWTFATHLFTVSEVGVASAALSTMNWLAALGGLGIGTLLIGELGRVAPDDRRGLLVSGLAVAGLATSGLAIAWLCIAPLFGQNLASSRSGVISILVFIAGAAATSAATTYDAAVLGVDDSHGQLLRNAVASASKVALLPVMALLTVRSELHIVFTWTVTLIISLLVCLRRLRTPSAVPRARRRAGVIELIRRHGRGALQHHMLNLVLQSTPLLLPVVVAVLMPAREIAFFNSAWLVSGFVTMLPYMLTIALFSATAQNPAALSRSVRRTLPLGLGFSATALLLLIPAAPLILHVFGSAYSAGAATALPLLAAAGMPLVVRDHYVAIARVRRRLSRATAFVAIATPFELVSAALGGHWGGLPGLCVGWVSALVFEALLVLPVLIRAMFRAAEPVLEPLPDVTEELA